MLFRAVFATALLVLSTFSIAEVRASSVLDCFRKNHPYIGLITPQEEALIKLIRTHKSSAGEAWIKDRGQEHFQKLNNFASKLEKEYGEHLSASSSVLKSEFDNIGTVTSRSKLHGSILAKLLKKDRILFENGQPGFSSFQGAKKAIGDGIGIRILFRSDKNGIISQDLVQEFVDELSEQIRKGLRVTEVINYRARGNSAIPYLSEDQIKQIARADMEFRYELQKKKNAGQDIHIPEPVLIKTGADASHPTGYTSLHLNIEYPNGIQAEIQVRGSVMQDTAEIQHLFYDIDSGKLVAPHLRSKPAIQSAVSIYENLPEDMKSLYRKYIENKLKHARKAETGYQGSAPKLPAGIPENLDFDSLQPHLNYD